jgi:S-(hydroxymethyl)glutathione dehydrogenase/alcohol dehydrogenase
MTTRAAICRKPGTPWEITDLELDDPKSGEVRIQFAAAGLCHSDDHIQKGTAPMRMPVVGGHEGAGIVDAVGPGVTRVAAGDHVACSFVSVCGTCRYCATGRQNLCEKSVNAATGMLPDGTFRFHADGVDVGGMCVLGTFSEYAVVSEFSVIPIPGDIPFDVAALVSCGVPTGWGSAVYVAGVRAGDTVVIYGSGGVGGNAVQGARFAGAATVVVVDPVPYKREMAEVLGATHTFADAAKAHEFVVETTSGELADHAVITVGELDDEVIGHALGVVGRSGQVTITAVGGGSLDANPGQLIGFQRRVQGAVFGGCNPLYDVPRLLALYRSGHLKIDELITRRYRLEDVNEGYRDMADGKNIRGVIIHEEGP